MKRFKTYPSWFYSVLLLVVTFVSVSGLLMIPTLMEFKLDLDVNWRLSGVQRLLVVAAHVFTCWIFLLLLGALWQNHMRAGWRKRKNYFSGITLCCLLFILSISGIGLYYLGSDQGQLITSLTHTLIGIVMIMFFIWHAWQGSTLRKNKGHSD